MKKYLLAALLMAAPTIVFAQLVVKSTGNVTIGGESTTILADGKLLVKKTGSTGYISSALCGQVATESTPSYATVGVLGMCNTTGGNYNYGLAGFADGATNGIGVYGSRFFMPDNQTGNYAGYFRGQTIVDGLLTATAVTTTSDIRLKENITPLRTSLNKGATLQSLMEMNVIRYNFKRRELKTDSCIPEKSIDDAKKEIEIMHNQKHFGLSAQELQRIYPELVYEGQDGYLSINYMELVPILIQSIQELKQELDAVKGGSEYKTRSVGDEATDFNAAATGNVLYQNTPNPFKEQTTIRFRLADDATNAAICIFDMSGKMLKKLPVSRGMTSVTINGYDLDEGLYLYSLVVNGMEIDTKRMVLSK